MASLDQRRAQLAHEHVSEFVDASGKNTAGAKKYATMVHKLPALLHSAGLCQALHFIASRGNEHQDKLLVHLAKQMKRVDSSITNDRMLLNAVRRASLPEYLRLTQEAHACASWYRRMVQGVLKVEAGDEDPDA